MITLEPFDEFDIDQLIAWIPSAEFLLQWAGSAFQYPLDRDQLTRHLAHSHRPASDWLIFKAVNSETGATVGHGELARINRRDLSAWIARVLVGPPELRGQGIGGQIVEQLLRVAFEELGLHRVELNVFDFNEPAIRCYERVGFKREGLLREARRHGDEYWSVYVLGMLEGEYRRAYT
jgi:RimJ/RimL family protein N-acetyltransferase